MTNVSVEEWTGAEARLLRQALRLSVRGFAAHTGIAARTLTRWESSDISARLRPDSQAVLDTTLAQAPPQACSRFAALLREAGGSHLASNNVLVTPAPSQTSAAVGGPSDLLTELDATRRRITTSLTRDGTKPRLDGIAERISDHLAVYTRSSPTEMLRPLLYDIQEVDDLITTQHASLDLVRLSESTAILAVLIADSLMKLGEISRASYWYNTARTAADDSRDNQLRALVRAQEAMLPYYFGRIERAVDLARSARELSQAPNDTAALATAAEARGLAILGDQYGARSAMSAAWDMVESFDPPPADRAFQFDAKRLMLYASSTFTHLGDTSHARDVQRQALDKYDPIEGSVIDPALIRLDAAVCAGLDGDIDEACGIVSDTVATLPEAHRTEIVFAKAKAVVPAIAPRHRSHRSVQELQDLLTEHSHGHNDGHSHGRIT